MKVLIFSFLMTTVSCLRLQLFESPDYHDLFQEFELSSTEERSCVSIKDYAKIGSIKTDKCIMVYGHDSCSSNTFARFDNDTQHTQSKYFESVLKSFHVCSQELGGGPLLDVNFTVFNWDDKPILKTELIDQYGDTHNEPLDTLEYKNVCGCKNIPTSFAKLVQEHTATFDSHGNGLAVFEKENCEPPHFYLPVGRILLVDRDEYPQTQIKMRSFSPMGTTNCVRLNASVTKFTFASDPTSKLMNVENVTSSLESVFRNNGTAKISQDYTVAQRYKESLEFTKATGWSTVHKVGLSGSVESKTNINIPLLLSAEVTVKVGASYDWTDTHSGTDTERRTVENEETTTIRQAIEIPPCTEYYVNSYVQMATNHSIDYTATARLTGKAGDDIMHAKELKKNVGVGMEFVRELDEFAIEVEVKGQMFAKYGMKTFIVGEGKPIEGCLQNIAKNSKPNVQKHFKIELPLKKAKE